MININQVHSDFKRGEYMTSEEAKKYLEGDTSFLTNDSQSEDETKGSPADDTPTPESNISEEGTVDHGTTQEEDGGPNPEDHHEDSAQEAKPTKDKLPYKDPKNIKEIKANKSFIKQKNKYISKLKSKEDEIIKLKAQLAKFESIKPEDLGNDPSKIADLNLDKKILARDIQNSLSQREEILNEAHSERADEIHQRRIEMCFESSTDAERYINNLETNREPLVKFLNKTDRDNTVLQFLDDSDYSPLLINAFLANPNLLANIVKKSNPLTKMVELKQLENRIVIDRKLRSKAASRSAPNNQNNSKGSKGALNNLPSTGRQVSSVAHSASSAIRDKAYWDNYLKNHP